MNDNSYIFNEMWSAGRIIGVGYLPNSNDIELFRDFPFFDGDTNTMNDRKSDSISQLNSKFRRSKRKTAFLKQNLKGIPFTGQMYTVARKLKNH